MATAAISHVGRDLAIPRENEGLDIPAMARKLWRPMLAMGLMTVAAGVIAGIVQANLDLPLHVAQVAAWNPGLLFLGIGFLLSAVTFRRLPAPRRGRAHLARLGLAGPAPARLHAPA